MHHTHTHTAPIIYTTVDPEDTEAYMSGIAVGYAAQALSHREARRALAAASYTPSQIGPEDPMS